MSCSASSVGQALAVSRAAQSTLLIVALWALPLAAQRSAALDRIDALVTAGRAEGARTALMEWWRASAASPGYARGPGGGPSRTDLQHALWLRALLTVDPNQAALTYQRLVVEYPGGPWSDQALLRLGQHAEAQGELARARMHLQALLRDYPGSPRRLEAGRLLREIEAALASAPASRASPEEPAPRVGRAAEPTRDWTVQVGALASPTRARELSDRLASAGIDARVVTVPGDRLLRVRAGRFSDPERAEFLRRELLARGFDAALSSDAGREEAVP